MQNVRRGWAQNSNPKTMYSSTVIVRLRKKILFLPLITELGIRFSWNALMRTVAKLKTGADDRLNRHFHFCVVSARVVVTSVDFSVSSPEYTFFKSVDETNCHSPTQNIFKHAKRYFLGEPLKFSYKECQGKQWYQQIWSTVNCFVLWPVTCENGFTWNLSCRARWTKH